MSDTVDGRYALTQPVIMAFPQLFEAKAVGKKGQATGKPKYSANFVLVRDGVDHKALKDLAIKIANERWPGRSIKELKFPFSNGDKLADARIAKGKKDGEFQRGHSVLISRSTYEPALATYKNGQAIDLAGANRAAAKNEFYPGVMVLASFTLAPYDGVGQNPDGVCAYLQSVMTLNKGTRLAGGQAAASETFKGYVGHATDEDPTVGAPTAEETIEE